MRDGRLLLLHGEGDLGHNVGYLIVASAEVECLLGRLQAGLVLAQQVAALAICYKFLAMDFRYP